MSYYHFFKTSFFKPSYFELGDLSRCDEPILKENRTGVLLVNLGTPDAPTAQGLRSYLRSFLSDPRVVEVSPILWSMILNLIILPFRPCRTAKLYKNIWTALGSPLLINTSSQASALSEYLKSRNAFSDCATCTNDQSDLNDQGLVDYAMCYGNPSIPTVMRRMSEQGVRRLVVIPLFPQYSGTTTGAVFDKVCSELKTWRWIPELHFVDTFHDHPDYIKGLCESVKSFWSGGVRAKPDKLLMSFHGLPKRYVKNGDPYYAYCMETGRLLAKELGLTEDAYVIAFQSRFGKEAWLMPYTDEVLESLAASGCKSVDVICPGFLCDCLETLDEIGREALQHFSKEGRELRYIPCMNASSSAIKLLASLIPNWKEMSK